MKLPNPSKTFIDNNKLAGYSLNVNHDEGKHKARVFKSALNLTIDHLEELKQALLSSRTNLKLTVRLGNRQEATGNRKGF